MKMMDLLFNSGLINANDCSYSNEYKKNCVYPIDFLTKTKESKKSLLMIDFLIQHGLNKFCLSNLKNINSGPKIEENDPLFYISQAVLRVRTSIHFQRIAHNLFSLGLAFCNEHSGGHFHLDQMKTLIEFLRSENRFLLESKVSETNYPHFCAINIALSTLEQLCQRYQSGPLTLRELARNRIRHVIGGLRFRTRANSLTLPKPLIEFIILRSFADMT